MLLVCCSDEVGDDVVESRVLDDGDDDEVKI